MEEVAFEWSWGGEQQGGAFWDVEDWSQQVVSGAQCPSRTWLGLIQGQEKGLQGTRKLMGQLSHTEARWPGCVAFIWLLSVSGPQFSLLKKQGNK